MMYLFSRIVTTMLFASAHDAIYDNFMFSRTFINFAFETQLSWYLLYPEPRATKLSILAIVAHGIQTVLPWFMSGDVASFLL